MQDFNAVIGATPTSAMTATASATETSMTATTSTDNNDAMLVNLTRGIAQHWSHLGLNCDTIEIVSVDSHGIEFVDTSSGRRGVIDAPRVDVHYWGHVLRVQDAPGHDEPMVHRGLLVPELPF